MLSFFETYNTRLNPTIGEFEDPSIITPKDDNLKDFNNNYKNDAIAPSRTIQNSIIISDNDINDLVELVLCDQMSSNHISAMRNTFNSDNMAYSPETDTEKQIKKSENKTETEGDNKLKIMLADTKSKSLDFKSIYENKTHLINKARKLQHYLIEKGLIKDRKFHFKTYRQCFVGKDIIPIIINLKLISISENKSKNERKAVAFANELLQNGIIQHVTKEHKFENKYLFYQFLIIDNGNYNHNTSPKYKNSGMNSGMNFDLKRRSHLHSYRKSKTFKHSTNDINNNIGNKTLLKNTFENNNSYQRYDYEHDNNSDEKEGCWDALTFYFESFLVVHARIYALWLLSYQILTRALVIFDMYTDIIIALELYTGNEKIWFMLSCLFICLPFVLVWSAS
eukprot:275671_1